jgi:hypothetical protein
MDSIQDAAGFARWVSQTNNLSLWGFIANCIFSDKLNNYALSILLAIEMHASYKSILEFIEDFNELISTLILKFLT